jgi:hypothetical protein
MTRHTITEQWALAARVEYFFDEKGVLIPTGTSNNFKTVSGSINLDYASASNLLWRLEARVLSSKDAIYPSHSGMHKTDGFIVMSAALSL